MFKQGSTITSWSLRVYASFIQRRRFLSFFLFFPLTNISSLLSLVWFLYSIGDSMDVGGAARRRIHRSAFLDLRQPVINRQPYLPRYRPHLLSLRPLTTRQVAKTIRISRSVTFVAWIIDMWPACNSWQSIWFIADRWEMTRKRERKRVGLGKDFKNLF